MDGGRLPPRSSATPAFGLPRSFSVATDPEQKWAAGEFKTLCETVPTPPTAASLQALATENLPDPAAPGARVLGCALQLADDEDSARSWWQYVAGVGDDSAPYCFYLRHLKHGDADAAQWWLRPCRIDQVDDEPATHVPDYDASFPTLLRVLTQLDAKTRPVR